MEGFFQATGISARIAMTTSSNETIKQAVMAGMGVALISRHTIGLELRMGLLRTLPVEGFPLMRSWFVTHRPGMPLLPIHAQLRGFLLEHGKHIIDELERSYRAIATARHRERPTPTKVRATPDLNNMLRLDRGLKRRQRGVPIVLDASVAVLHIRRYDQADGGPKSPV